MSKPAMAQFVAAVSAVATKGTDGLESFLTDAFSRPGAKPGNALPGEPVPSTPTTSIEDAVAQLEQNWGVSREAFSKIMLRHATDLIQESKQPPLPGSGATGAPEIKSRPAPLWQFNA